MRKCFLGIFCPECASSSLGYLLHFLEICVVSCVNLAHLRTGDREDIFVTHRITIIKSEVSIFPIVFIFSVVVCPRWLYHQMLSVPYISRESWVLFSLILCILMMCANDGVHYGPMVVFVCLHITQPQYHHYADVSERIELLKCLSYTFCRGCAYDQVSSLSYLSCNIWGYLYSAYAFLLWWLSEYAYFILSSSTNRKYDPSAIV